MEGATLPYRSVLVTGSSGFVGKHLLGELRFRLAEGAIIHRIDRNGRPSVDLLNFDEVQAAVATAQPDLIIHLAAQSSVGQSAGAAANTWRVNVCGTLNLAEAIAAEAPSATVAFASSSEVYGAAFNSGPVNEQTEPLPQSVYARTKRTGEDVLNDLLTQTNRLVIFRPGNHSGPGQDTRFVMPAFADQVAAIEAGAQEPTISVGSLVAERDFLDVRDVVDAYLDVLAEPGGSLRETFNIASGSPVAIGHILEELLALSSSDIVIKQDPSRVRTSDILCAEIDASKIRHRLGWQPRFSLQQTVSSVLADHRRRYEIQAGGDAYPEV